MLVTKIKEYRARFNLRQDELAEKVCVRRETINKLERGLYNPSLKLAMDIANVFKTKVEDIFEFKEE
ncbi:helix-turn-helix transcriptional regulator [Anaerovorax odorimutans]|uniref:helix-turn-helix transcriptional regulator n=1 Tax=Anaerovorax odorimutans TaxID=109327 RepID=UPI0004121AFC|nr:helix-turn-helix transcriptional regulator [Anaerovorax odorimutans]